MKCLKINIIMKIEDVLMCMRKDYSVFLRRFTNRYPYLAQKKFKHYGKVKASAYSLLLRIIVMILRLFCLNKPPKYVFQGLRHIHLIKVLPPSDVMIMGGNNEFFYCHKMGYRFHWAGYLGKCFELFYFAKKKGALSDAVLFVRKYFTSPPGLYKYLFLWEDTQPIGLSLSLALRDVVGINVVCIAHGYDYAFSEKTLCVDGSNCRFNFVYDAAQAKLVNNLFNNSPVFVLGLPCEVNPANTLKSKVVLVEHTGIAAGVEYIISVYHFLKLYCILEHAGFDVIYRARPGGDTAYARSMFSNVYDGDKFELFAEGRMIFMGFSSTLLYEAKVFGNIVVGLDTSELFDQRNFDVDMTVSADEYKDLPSLLLTLMSKRLAHPVCNVDSLSSRFFKCIESIEGYNKNHG